jgi:hypothetical protein
VCSYCESVEDPEHKLQACCRCRLVAYCSKECQKAHWKNGHKQTCVPVQDRKLPQLSVVEVTQEAKKSVDVVCVICLESLQPSSSCTLPCKHSFHGKCVSNLRSQSSTSQVCPLCRTDLPPGPEQAYSECMKLYYSVTNKMSSNESEDTREAIRLANCAAEEGSIKAQAFLGFCFSTGLGVAKDDKMAFHWRLKAAEQGHVDAQNNVGFAYYKGEGVEQDLTLAFQWVMKAAVQGHVEAQYNVGACFRDGQGVKQDKVMAFHWFMKAAEQGSCQAQCYIGVSYAKGRGVKQDMAKAFYWSLKAAEQGYAEAQYHVGYCYDHSDGVKHDMAKAIYWYMKAAKQGFAGVVITMVIKSNKTQRKQCTGS